jgi:acetyl esterase/lipase
MAAQVVPPEPPEGVEVCTTEVAGVPCTVCQPAVWATTIAYFHGGGYRLGSARGSTGFGQRLVQATGARVVLVDYRLAPEHPFPAALHDATAVVGALAAEPGALVLGGDSAGGGLAAAVAGAAGRSGRVQVAALVCLSPWADLRNVAASYTTRAATDELFSLASATAAAELYLQGHDPTDPLVSPVLADLATFPPTLVLASSAEVLLDDGVALTRGLAGAGVAVEAHLVPGLPHVWPTLLPDHPESARALAAIHRFLVERA